MTCREKLKMEYPENVNAKYDGGCSGCPSTYCYMYDDESLCASDSYDACTKCWDREIPGTEPTVREEKPELRPIDPHHVFNEIAKVHRACYDSYRNFGFTDEQAFELVRILFEAGIGKR